jgi:hypothetical protein
VGLAQRDGEEVDVLNITAKAKAHPHIKKRLSLHCGAIECERKGPILSVVEKVRQCMKIDPHNSSNKLDHLILPHFL